MQQSTVALSSLFMETGRVIRVAGPLSAFIVKRSSSCRSSTLCRAAPQYSLRNRSSIPIADVEGSVIGDASSAADYVRFVARRRSDIDFLAISIASSTSRIYPWRIGGAPTSVSDCSSRRIGQGACLALIEPDCAQVLPEIVAGRHVPALDLLVVDDNALPPQQRHVVGLHERVAFHVAHDLGALG